jgi:hypothetical protein
MVAAKVPDMTASTSSESGSARVAVFTRTGTMSVGCMRSTSGVCHVLIKTPMGLERLAVKGGTVGGAAYASRPIRIAVGAEPPDPKHCVFHEIVQEDQMISGPDL